MRIAVLAIAPAFLFAGPVAFGPGKAAASDKPVGSECIQQTDDRSGCDHRRPEPTTS